ncbi:threonine/serine exporter [Clostridium botulinum]|nr:threonine/serine exporter [Clostridium botulinum]
MTGSSIIGSFWGAFVVNAYSEIMARIIKTPASMFYVPGIFPLVPGITAYRTINAIVENNYSEALNSGILTLAIGGAIVLGIMISSIIVKFLFKCSIHRNIHCKE